MSELEKRVGDLELENKILKSQKEVKDIHVEMVTALKENNKFWFQVLIASIAGITGIVTLIIKF